MKVPVTIDVESGYSDEPAAVGELLRPALESGIAGINIEDGADAPDLLARKVEVIKKAASSMGSDLFVNVRTDVYLRGLAPADRRVAETLRRAAIYRSAGADGLFVPGIVDASQIAEVTAATQMPLNVMSFPGIPRLAELAKLDVRRLSAGSALSQVIWQQIAHLSERFLAEGDSGVFTGESMSYGQLQALFAAAR